MLPIATTTFDHNDPSQCWSVIVNLAYISAVYLDLSYREHSMNRRERDDHASMANSSRNIDWFAMCHLNVFNTSHRLLLNNFDYIQAWSRFPQLANSMFFPTLPKVLHAEHLQLFTPFRALAVSHDLRNYASEIHFWETLILQ